MAKHYVAFIEEGRGLCRHHDPHLWFPDPGESGEKAKAICAVCPVQHQCLAWALDNREVWGIWGGYSAPERDHMRNVPVALTVIGRGGWGLT